MTGKFLFSAQDIVALPEVEKQHFINGRAVRRTRALGDAAGLRRLGAHLVRLAPGGESTAYHRHHQEEEFLYILSGRGETEIGDGRHAVGPGDFLAFPADGPAHTLRNTGDDDLVYLLAGERRDFDVCDYPRAGKRLIRYPGGRVLTDL